MLLFFYFVCDVLFSPADLSDFLQVQIIILPQIYLSGESWDRYGGKNIKDDIYRMAHSISNYGELTLVTCFLFNTTEQLLYVRKRC